MKLKFLLFTFLLWGGFLSAQDYIYQDTINYLVISEARMTTPHQAYLELTNMGNKPVQLNQFHLGFWGGGSTIVDKKTSSRDYRIPVDIVLQPGESYVFATAYDWNPTQYNLGRENVAEKHTQDNMWGVADYLVHMDEDGDDSEDMVSRPLSSVFSEQWGPGMNGMYIEQHFANGDSIVIDQVGGMFIGPGGTQLNRTAGLEGYDVAGVYKATGNCYLIRRNVVKTGNLDFANARGVGMEDSEWIPIRIHGSAWRLAPWTIGNHGDYNLDANTLESDVIEVDFANKKLTVPWGVRRGDDIMSYFKQKPGIAWEYIMSATADSLTHAAQTGDKLNIYVCGNDVDFATFEIVVKNPAANANMLVPVTNEDPTGGWRNAVENGILGWPRITKNAPAMDTIWGARGGIPYATRVDSLLETLQKPSNAKWEIVYKSGEAKPDLANGDKIKVIAQDGSVKEYFIKVNPYRASTNSSLSAIQWPDIPEFYKGIFGWIGDTIPGFSPRVYNYTVEVPLMVEGVPALAATKMDVNAKLEVKRAKNLAGGASDRTVNFIVTAEDDTTISNYSVVLSKEKNPENLQPYRAEPFISEVCFNMGWQGNDFLEIVNPGNLPLDLSDYMLIGDNIINPADAISQTNENDWLMRYEKYIPGYKWPNQLDWPVNPYIAKLDVSVNAIVMPGDVFTLGAVNKEQPYMCSEGWAPPGQLDVQFFNGQSDCNVWKNQWGEDVHADGTPMSKFFNQHIFLFKILNDSIKKGLKPATDPNDFELIDVVGMGESKNWTVGGKGINNPFSIVRKSNIYKGNPIPGESLGVVSEDDVEWDVYNIPYWNSRGYGWPARMILVAQDLGKHFMESPTQYMSTVSSVVYKVSEGYSMNEQIKGMKTGTTVSEFLGNIIKANEKQSLKVTRNGDTELPLTEMLKINDVLTVISADSTNTTKYVLDVTEQGLSSNAILTSSRYSITIQTQPKSAESSTEDGSATITGFEYGTSLRTVVNNVVVPAGASMTVINGQGAYVPLKQLNFDTVYVNNTVNANTYFEVTAENGITRILYKLIPQSSESDAFVTSDMYSVVQKDLVIEYVPRGITVQNFLAHLVPSFGATMKVVDKKGFERIDGTVADDDKVVVTSSDKKKTVVYHISKLATLYTPKTTYLAYILSNIYPIDQVEYKVFGVSGTAPISEFFANIKVAAGATAVIVNKDGVQKTSGDIDGTDMVKVTSADGKINVMYSFGQLTKTDWVNASQIELYPNPTNGMLNVTGVERGQRIQVYNSLGTAIVDYHVEKSHELISIDQHPAGMYLIVISNKNRLLGKYKAIKY